MKPPTSKITRLLNVVCFAVVICTLSAANAAVPTDISERLRQTAGLWQTSVDQQRLLTGNAPSTAMASELDRQVYSSMMAQIVMEAITRSPADALDVTNAAIGAAPDLKAEIVRNLSIAFPTMATAFAGAGQPARATQMTAPAVPRAPSLRQQPRDAGDDDPLEGFNRAMFGLNDILDSILLAPIAKAYRFIMPETLREMGRNFFENLNEPVVAINDVLQGDFSNAGVSVGRLAVNSTIGLFGFFEVAERLDLKAHPADFGQTLHHYGVGSGPFVMLPFFGPSTIRDTAGSGIDSFLNPIGYFLDVETRLYLKASEIVVKREAILDQVDQLREGSVDFYSAVKSSWLQKRAQELRKGAPPQAENIDALFADVK
jgi:phospholipid-binding lipoprotein MlaA